MRAELRESQVGPGAVLEVEGTAYRVVGSLRFDLDGTAWGEHCITASGPRHWLSLRPRGGPSVIHWRSRHDLFGEPDRAGVTLDGRHWTLLEAGSLTYTAEGDTGTGTQGSCDFVEFIHADELLVFESFDGAVWEISVGTLVDPAQVRSYREATRD
jgi:hypothetical protein